jgi:hypothetical protein
MGQRFVAMGANLFGRSTSLRAQSHVDGWKGVWGSVIVISRERFYCIHADLLGI